MFPAVSYTAANKSNDDALQWMINENDDQFSTLRIARELLGSPGADIILMVVPSTTDNDCGATPFIPTLAGNFRSETNAFAITYLEDLNPTCKEEVVVPHEVGHLLYAEHDTDTNADNVSPDPENHATTSTSTGQKTLMWDGIHPLGTEFLSGHFPTTTVPGWADNVEFFSDDSFDIVASYRAPPPPPAPDCELAIEFRSCEGAQATQAITATLFGSTVVNSVYDVSSNNSSWSNIFEGLLSCPSFAATIGMWGRASLTLSTGQLSQCTIHIAAHNCNGNQNPW